MEEVVLAEGQGDPLFHFAPGQRTFSAKPETILNKLEWLVILTVEKNGKPRSKP